MANCVGLPKFEMANDQLVALVFVDNSQNLECSSIDRLLVIVLRNLLVSFDQ